MNPNKCEGVCLFILKKTSLFFFKCKGAFYYDVSFDHEK